MNRLRSQKASVYRQGIIVMLVLAVLTYGEFEIARNINSAVLLLLIAVFKGALVLNYFMHISRLWSEEEEH